jgi:hypothetical protein
LSFKVIAMARHFEIEERQSLLGGATDTSKNGISNVHNGVDANPDISSSSTVIASGNDDAGRKHPEEESATSRPLADMSHAQGRLKFIFPALAIGVSVIIYQQRLSHLVT